MQYVKENEEINNIIIGRDVNQDITSREVQELHKYRVKDIYQVFNYIEVKDLYYTFQRRPKCIESIATISNIL